MSENDTTPGDELTRVSDATRQAEQREAMKPADAGSEPTADESEAAAHNKVDPKVARANKRATERGAHVKGEGSIE
jgi:hypothetical protein